MTSQPLLLPTHQALRYNINKEKNRIFCSLKNLQVAKDSIVQIHMLNQTTQGKAPKKMASKTCYHKDTLLLNDMFNMDICQDGFLWEHI